MTRNLLVCTSSMMAIVFGAAGSAAAQNHAQHNNMGNAACVLGSGNSGNCSGAVRVVEQIQIQSTGAPSAYRGPVTEVINAPVSSCAGAIAQKVPCDGQWVRSGENTNAYSGHSHSHHGSANGAHHSSSHAVSYVSGYDSGNGAAVMHNSSGNYATGPLHSIPRGFSGEQNGHSVYNQNGPAQYGSGMDSQYGKSAYSSSSYSTSSTDTGYYIAGQAPTPVTSGIANLTSSYGSSGYNAPMYSAPVSSGPNYGAPVYNAPVYNRPIYAAPVYSAPVSYSPAPMPIDGISPVFFYGGNMSGVGANVHGGYGGGGGSYFSGGSRFSGIANYTRLTPPGPKSRPNPPPPPPPPN